MSEDPSTPAASGGLDTMNNPVQEPPLNGAAVAIRAAEIGQDLVGGASMPEFDIKTLPPRSASEGVGHRHSSPELIFDPKRDGPVRVEASLPKAPAVSGQEVDMDKKLSGPQDESVEAPVNETVAAAKSVDDLVKESTVAAWPGALMDEAPELNDDGSVEVNGIEAPYNSDAAFSKSPTTTSEYDNSSEMPATTTPSNTSPMETTTPTTSTYTEVPSPTTSTTPNMPPAPVTIPSDNE